MTSVSTQFNDYVRRLGDRRQLFEEMAKGFPIERVLYVRGYVDITPSFVFPHVTYLDTDNRAKAFFEDANGVQRIIARSDPDTTDPEVRFVPGEALPPRTKRFDLLVSLRAGLGSQTCKRYLKKGGVLLTDNHDGDASMALVDPDFQPVGVILDNYGKRPRLDVTDPMLYMEPKVPGELDEAWLRANRKGARFTRFAFAYVFEKVR